MKKIALLMLSVFTFAAVNAVEPKAIKGEVQKPATEKQVKVSNLAGQEVNVDVLKQNLTSEKINNSKAIKAVPKEFKKVKPTQKNGLRKAAKAEEDDTFYALYQQPEGTLFCGVDEAGTYLFFNYPSIVGGRENFTYRNKSYNADNVNWTSRLYARYPQYFSFDEDNNFTDSITSFYVYEGASFFPTQVALKRVASDLKADTFVLLGNTVDELDTIIYYNMVWAGAVNQYLSFEDTKMFPLTRAMVSNMDFNFDYSTDLLWSIDTTATGEFTGDFSYIYGTKKLEYDLGESLDDESSLETVEVVPAALAVFYEKPHSPLYVREITVALNAINVIDETNAEYTDPTFNELTVRILSEDMERVLAESTCQLADTTNNMYFPGALARFPFREVNEFGLVVSEGVTLDEPFVVVLTGLDQEDANFGITSSYNPYFSNEVLVIDTALNVHSYVNYDPYIMLNGVYYTLVDEGYNDTILMNVEYEDGYYFCVHADGNMKNYAYSWITASELLYDTVTLSYNCKINAPDWLNVVDMLYAQDDTNFWEDYGDYALFLQGAEEDFDEDTELPQVGDQIKISRFGRELVYKIVSVPQSSGINNARVANANAVMKENSIDLSFDISFKRANIYTVGGQLVGSYDLPRTGYLSVDASSLAKGVYMIQFEGAQSKTLQVIK